MSGIKIKPKPTKEEKSLNKAKWKNELSLVKKTFTNRWIYKIFRDWGTMTPKGFVPLHSNINIEECVLLNNIIHELRPKRVVEIGCAMGVSGMVMANALGRYCPGGSLTSVDPFQESQWGSVGVLNISRAIKHCKAKYEVSHDLVKALSSDYWKGSSQEDLDMVFIDGDHSYEGCLLDIMGSHRSLKDGGVVVIDDVLHPGPKKAITETYGSGLKDAYSLHPSSLATMSVWRKRAQSRPPLI